MLEVPVTVGMAAAFPRLAVDLAGVAQGDQQLADRVGNWGKSPGKDDPPSNLYP